MGLILKYLLLLFAVMFVVPRLLRALARLLTGPAQNGNAGRRSDGHYSQTRPPKKRKKAFPKDEGEYVDYVEVKD